MWAMIVKEIRELRRDRRTLAMLVVLPVLLLVVFGYAASFDVTDIRTVVVGPRASAVAGALPSPFRVVATDPQGGRDAAVIRLRDGDASVAIITGAVPPDVLVDGADLFTARAAEAALARLAGTAATTTGSSVTPRVEVLFNPDLTTSAVMVPGLCGLILVFIGTIVTSLGVVRERQAGTLEQLAVMPLRPWDVIAGKIAPYFAVAALDMLAIVVVGVLVFHVPFAGSIATFALGSALFLLVTCGAGVLISSVSENQGQAIQLALMTLLPQILLSGLVFPVASMAAGVRWLSYVLPLTYFVRIARSVMLRGTPLTALWEPMLLLAALGAVIFGLAVLRFRRDLAPAARAAHSGPESDAA